MAITFPLCPVCREDHAIIRKRCLDIMRARHHACCKRLCNCGYIRYITNNTNIHKARNHVIKSHVTANCKTISKGTSYIQFDITHHSRLPEDDQFELAIDKAFFIQPDVMVVEELEICGPDDVDDDQV